MGEGSVRERAETGLTAAIGRRVLNLLEVNCGYASVGEALKRGVGMARQVRGSVGGRRKWIAMFGAFGAVIAALIFLALPAFGGSVGGLITPRSLTEGLVPIERDLGGVDDDCAAVHSSAASSVRFENPSSLPPMPITVGGKPVRITSTVSNIGGEQFYAFSINGAVARDVIVKARSRIRPITRTTTPVSRSSVPEPDAAELSGGLEYVDAVLSGQIQTRSHSRQQPPRNSREHRFQKKLYTVSHVSFCLDTASSISGVVYNDSNGSRSSAGQPEIAGATVTLYDGSNLVGSRTTPALGGYLFSGLTIGKTYTVCQSPLTNWTRTAPTGEPNCPDGTRGYPVTPSPSRPRRGFRQRPDCGDFWQGFQRCGQWPRQ